jgi:hypothetical protein
MTVIKQYREGASSSFVKAQCMHCLAPACVSVCILGALHKTGAGVVAYEPGRYVPRVYGEEEGGGTQVLMLAAVPFEKLGLPAAGPEPVPALSETVQDGIYRGFLAPAVLYGLLSVVLWRNRRRPVEEAEEAPAEEEAA